MACDAENCVFKCRDTLSCALSTIFLDGTDQFDVLVSCSDMDEDDEDTLDGICGDIVTVQEEDREPGLD